VMSLRRTSPQLHRPLRLPGLSLIAPFAFVCASLILYWAKWPLTGEIIVLMLVALPVYFYYQAKAGWPDFKTELKGAWWMIAYLPTIAALSYCGSTEFGGHGYIPYGWDMGIVAVLSLFFYHWGVASGWHTRYLDEVDSVHEEQTEVRSRKRAPREVPQGV